MGAADPLRFLRDLAVPPRCATCAAACVPAVPLCRACALRLAQARGGSASIAAIGDVTWAAPYERTARALVAALKFGGSLGLARVAASAIAAALGQRPHEQPMPTGDRLPVEPPVVVAVPAAPLRRRRRGFDPAELIAAELARLLALEAGAPLRRADGPRQVGRRRGERLASPPRVRASGGVPMRVLLVDDVLTTGATLGACAAALRAAGAREVSAAVFARTLGERASGA